MRLLFPLSLLFVFLGFLSCSDPVQIENDSWKEVMRIHDEVMPEMATINRIKRELKAEIADTTALPTAARQEQVENMILQLESAEEGMMNWMYQVKNPETLREEMEHEAILVYLQEEQTKIEKVRDDMLTSIEQGQSLVVNQKK